MESNVVCAMAIQLLMAVSDIDTYLIKLMIKMVKQGFQMYKAPAIKTVSLFTQGSYMQLVAGSSEMGTEPSGRVPDYEIEEG